MLKLALALSIGAGALGLAAAGSEPALSETLAIRPFESLTVAPSKVEGRQPQDERRVEGPRVTFLRDVAPILNKAGCTAGTCHGAAKGKNGFKLSLRGYDPLAQRIICSASAERSPPET